MSNLPKKIILSFLSALIIFVSVSPFFVVKAAPPAPPPEGTWYNQGFGTWYSKVYDENVSPGNEIFGERYTAAQVQWVIYGLFAFILNASLGSSNQQVVSCFLTNTGDVNSCIQILQGMIGSGSEKPTSQNNLPQQSFLQAVFADRPFSGISYVRHELSKFSLVSEVHAQTTPDFGFNVLQPVQNMWRASRDVSFGLFVIVAVVFAFMIMFRVKISPQVVISVQSALPKLFIALILVTFSYAIAGFLIDLMYVVIGLVSLLGTQFLSFGGKSPTPAAIFNFLTLGQPIGHNFQPGTFGQNFQLGVFGLLIMYLVLFSLAFIVVLFTNLGILGGLIAGAGLTFLTAIMGPAIALFGVLAFIIVLILLIWHMLRIAWMLLKAFANILLLTIFAPLEITAGTILPSLGFGAWLKSYVSNLMTFVIAGVLILLMYVFLAQGFALAVNSFAGKGVPLGDFIANLIFGQPATATFTGAVSSYWPPLLATLPGTGPGAGASVGLVFLGVSLIIFTLIPKVNDMIQAFMSGKPFAYGEAIGEVAAPASFLYNQGPVKQIRGVQSARFGSQIVGFGADVAGTLGAQRLKINLEQAKSALEREAEESVKISKSQSGGANQ